MHKMSGKRLLAMRVAACTPWTVTATWPCSCKPLDACASAKRLRDVQTGKSYALNEVLAAVVRDHPRFGNGGEREVLLCPLDFERIASGANYQGALKALLLDLLGWAVGGQVLQSSACA